MKQGARSHQSLLGSCEDCCPPPTPNTTLIHLSKSGVPLKRDKTFSFSERIYLISYRGIIETETQLYLEEQCGLVAKYMATGDRHHGFESLLCILTSSVTLGKSLCLSASVFSSVKW